MYITYITVNKNGGKEYSQCKFVSYWPRRVKLKVGVSYLMI